MKEFNALRPKVTFTGGTKDSPSRFVKETIAGISSDMYCSFDDFGDGFQLAFFSFSPKKDDFTAIAEALVTKFGRPTRMDKVSKSNAMGAKFHGTEMEWENGTSRIVAEELGAKIDESRIIFLYRDPQGRKTREVIAKEKRSANDV
ncbi:hypothetical protein METEAL_15190 [Mesoterricola silvestris]|uniref:Uncharacterized protein n=2 Tax=Mesoterricola silvestris TaxID=2927979 RepID=A0AA48GQH6_9BACT|nr:hypothetical protein METEAL_15190 [Mesoterricola silvestris]